ncbi:SusC/RagA family TonB-linked outer membrane protein [Chitinophaga tropicalis]|uniref:SusC/RagA family TonB-linked outer membrane protein n=1 Tax=Chitinophaga tropicalis TaxID=2683588 RepID=A0A7K1U0Z5_9BACT|nr:TonB-dependent receptor [Chitinophaga tropicalis]MVT08041.1 SusC/RagA family TonB-linked outer membrane protein [Chitinophaga tropicalis]
MKNSDLLKVRHRHAWQSMLLRMMYSGIVLVCAPLRYASAETPAAFYADQDIIVKGKVVDKNNDPVIGATLKIVGTSKGTTTAPDGSFTLAVPQSAQVTVTAIGFLAQTISITGNAPLTITLEADTKGLSEVVVVGYGTQKKEAVSGAITTVKGAELVKSPATNLSNSIAGRMPGVTAMQNSGEPGYDGSSLRIRGSNTLGNNDPLVVIDGVAARQGGLERLNPLDIENISVLKDASAAIYGARAANGVILVTTKRGKVGKPQLSYSFNQGWSQPTHIPKMSNAPEYAQLRDELSLYRDVPASEWDAAWQVYKQNGTYTSPTTNKKWDVAFGLDEIQKFRDGTDPWLYPNTDWYKATFKTWSPQSNHSVQLSGGNENMRYLTSFGYQSQDAYYKKSATGYDQYSLRINLDGKINKYVNVSVDMLGRQEDRNFPTRTASEIFRMLMRGKPTEPAFWPNGLPGPDIEYGNNPVVITTDQTGYDKDKRYYLQTNARLDITVPGVQGLKLSGNVAFDKYLKRTKRWMTPWYLYTWDKKTYEADGTTPLLVKSKRGTDQASLNQADEDQSNMLLRGLLTYERSIRKAHNINFVFGIERETVNNDNFSALRKYFISSLIDQLFAGGDAEKDNNGSAWDRARLNYFGRAAYNYKEKYLAEFVWRYDGSYMFPSTSRFGFFPGLMLGWRVSEEKFWKDNVRFMDYLKVRASWGKLGNDQIYYDDDGDGTLTLQEYQYFSTYGFSSYILGGQMVKSLYEARIPNPYITWEVANNYNVGLDGALLKGKLYFELDAFVNKRTGILVRRNASVPQSTGMTLPAENIGKVDNKGWEFRIGYTDKVGKDFRYDVSVNGGVAKNKIVFWDEAPGAPAWQRSTGKPMNTGLFYQYDGVFRDFDAISKNTLDYSALSNNLRPGDMKFKDIDGNGKIDGDDRVRSDKSTQPTFTGGVNVNLQYRSFDMAILVQGAAGGALPVNTESGEIGNFTKDYYDHRWSPDKPSSVDPRVNDRNDTYWATGNTYWMRSTNYIRLKNVEIGYNLTDLVQKRTGITSLRLYANCLNLFTLDKLGILDPESINGNGQYYPQARVINAGFNLTF